MFFLFQKVAEESEKSLPYRIGYELGYFLGSHFYETLALAVIVALIFTYLFFFKKKRREKTIK